MFLKTPKQRILLCKQKSVIGAVVPYLHPLKYLWFSMSGDNLNFSTGSIFGCDLSIFPGLKCEQATVAVRSQQSASVVQQKI